MSTSADAVFVANSFDRPDLRMLGTIDHVENSFLVARRDHGISTSADLKGKKIGVTKKSSGEFFLGTLLIFNNLQLSDVEVVDLKPSQLVKAVVAGELDAIMTWDPNAYNARQQLGNNAVSVPGQGGQPSYFIVFSTEEFVVNNKAAVERFMRALTQGADYMRENDRAARNFSVDRFEYEESYNEDAWGKHKFVVDLTQAMVLKFEDIARWRIENNLAEATEVPNYLDYIYIDALESVKPER